MQSQSLDTRTALQSRPTPQLPPHPLCGPRKSPKSSLCSPPRLCGVPGRRTLNTGLFPGPRLGGEITSKGVRPEAWGRNFVYVYGVKIQEGPLLLTLRGTSALPSHVPPPLVSTSVGQGFAYENHCLRGWEEGPGEGMSTAGPAGTQGQSQPTRVPAGKHRDVSKSRTLPHSHQPTFLCRYRAKSSSVPNLSPFQFAKHSYYDYLPISQMGNRGF